MLPLLAFAGRTWAADYVKIGGHEIANGDTHANFNNSRIDSGSASLSSDGKTLTLDNMALSTGKADGIEPNRAGLKIVLKGNNTLDLSGDCYGMDIYQNVTITGSGSLTIKTGNNRTCLLLNDGAKLTLTDIAGGVVLSNASSNSAYGIAGYGSGNHGEVEIERTQVTIRKCKDSCFGDLKSVVIKGGEGTNIQMTGNGNNPTFDNVEALTLEGMTDIWPKGFSFSDGQKTILNSSKQPAKEDIQIKYTFRVPINETYFPDRSFRNYAIEHLDPNNDRVLMQDELDNITEINVANHMVSSFEGIQYFKNLTKLDCTRTSIKVLDMSQNTKIKDLNAHSCGDVTSINLTGCDDLERIDFSWLSSMDNIDLSGMKKLKWLDCSHCLNLAKLNLQNCSALEELSVNGGFYYAKLNSIDLTGCTALKSLNCFTNNNLPALNLSGCTSLERLDCHECAILKNIIFPTSIKYVNFERCEVKSTNLKNCPNLVEVNCYGNHWTIPQDVFIDKPNLTTLNAGCNYFTNVKISNCPKITTLNFDNSSSKSIFINNAPLLTTMTNDKCDITTLYLKDCPALTDIGNCAKNNMKIVKLDNVGFTQLDSESMGMKSMDSISVLNCQKLTKLNVRFNNPELFVTANNCPILETINISQVDWKSITLKTLPGLKNLDCSHNRNRNRLALDLSECPALETLNFSQGTINNINLSTCTNLKEIIGDMNYVSSIDLSHATKLKKVNFFYNILKSISLPKCQTLEYIDVSRNQLTSLTISDCADDAKVYCYGNILRDAEVDNLMNNLPDKSEHSPAIYYLDKSSGTEDNTCTMAQLAVAAAKGWKLFYYNGQDWLPFLGSDSVPTAIDAPENPIVETDGASPLYNLQGQRVGDNYKGIVIVNGKKVRRK